jgi:hypothetical protein
MTRRRRLIACVAALGLVLAAVPTAEAREEFVPGTANASTQLARVRLFYAGFGYEVSAGTTIASYRNQTSRASSSAVDASFLFNIIGVPGPAATTATSADGDQSFEQALADPLLGRTAASATRQPASSAASELADLSIPGILEVRAGETHAQTELVPGDHRLAVATTEVASIVLAGGLVELRGLRWTASHRTAAGLPLPIAGSALGSVLSLVENLLAPVGLVLDWPEVVELSDGSIDISGLRIGIANSPLGAQLIAPLVAGLRPLLLPILDAVTGANEDVGILGLFVDLGLGIVDGSGGALITVGGANAGTNDRTFADLFGPRPQAAPPAAIAPPAPLPAPALAPAPAPVAAPIQPRPAPDPTVIVEVGATGPVQCVLSAALRSGSCRGENVPAALATIALALAALGLLEMRARGRRQAPTSGGL